MKPVAKRATPAAIAVLRQATALAPKRNKASDGLLPSKAHILQNPNSDHNTGHAVDLTHDPHNGIDCGELFHRLQQDNRVSYLIFNGLIWSKERGTREYSGPNKHVKHLHISIKEECAKDTSPWFAWMGTPKPLAKVKAKVTPKPKKKDQPSPKEN
jgi:hypothetical protein